MTTMTAAVMAVVSAGTTPIVAITVTTGAKTIVGPQGTAVIAAILYPDPSSVLKATEQQKVCMKI